MRAEVRQTGIIKSGQLAHPPPPPPHLFLLSADTSTGASHSRKERASARIILLLIHFPPLVDLFKESAIVYSTQERLSAGWEKEEKVRRSLFSCKKGSNAQKAGGEQKHCIGEQLHLQ